ncbi:MAG: flippase [Propionicimonas sp.]
MDTTSDRRQGGGRPGPDAALLDAEVEAFPTGSDESGGPSAGAEAPGRSLGANVATLATSQLITWTLTLLWTFIVPRLLGPQAIGLLVIATSLASLVTVVLSFMTRDFLVREIVSDRAGVNRLVSTALLTRAAAIPLGFVAATVYGHIAGLDREAMAVMYLTAAATGCVILMDVALATFQASERMQYIAYTDVGSKSLNTLGGVLLALTGFGIVAVSSFSVLVAALALGVALWWAHRLVGLGARPAPAIQVLRKAGPYWLISVLFVAYVWTDGFLLGILVPTEVVGWYGAATRLFTTMGFVAVIVATASLPRMIAAHAESPDRMFAAARQPFEWVFIAGLPLGVGMACTANDLVPFLYGHDYANSVIPLVILSLGLPLTYVNTVAAQVFIASGRPNMIAWLLATASAFNIALNLMLIPLTQEQWGNGAIGAAASLFLTEVVQVCMCMAIIGRKLMSRPALVRLGSAALAAAGMAAAVTLTDAAPLAIQVLLGAVTFVGLCLLLRVPKTSESEMAREGLRRLRGRSRIMPRSDLVEEGPA